MTCKRQEKPFLSVPVCRSLRGTLDLTISLPAMKLQTAPNPSDTDHKSQFDAQGYCVVDGLWTEQEIQEIEDLFEEYKHNGMNVFDVGFKFDEIDRPSARCVPCTPTGTAARRWNGSSTRAWAKCSKFCLGRPAFVAQSMYYFKPPGARGQNMHQDNMYLMAQPNTCIAAWTAIDDATLDNGCLYVVPGSHRDKLICEGGRVRRRLARIRRAPHQEVPARDQARPGGSAPGADDVLRWQPDPRFRPEPHQGPQSADVHPATYADDAQSDARQSSTIPYST